MLTLRPLPNPTASEGERYNHDGLARPIISQSKTAKYFSRSAGNKRADISVASNREELSTVDTSLSSYEEKASPMTQNNAVSGIGLDEIEILTELPACSRKKEAPKQGVRRQIFNEIVGISLPALGTLLAEPLMSLVDTICVGQISSIQLAALGPNAAIFNMTYSLLTFVSAALANRLARNSLKQPGLSGQEIDQRRENNESVLSHSYIFATGLGLFITCGLLLNGHALLEFLGVQSEAYRPALDYLYIRALAAPAVMFVSVSQGACLGQQDMRTPLRVMAAAGSVNLFGDVVLIMGLDLGTAGAAAATAMSETAAALYYCRYLQKGGNDGKGVVLKWKGFPTTASLRPIFDMGRILLARNVVLALAFNGMTSVATGMGVHVIAAHQVVLQLYSFLTITVDSLSLAAQSLLAKDLHNSRKVRHLTATVMQCAAVTGLSISLAFGSILSYLPRIFTHDDAVITILQKVIPYGMISLLLLALVVTFEGVCVGIGRINQLPFILFPSAGVALGNLWNVKVMGLGLTGVWNCTFVFFSLRSGLHVLYVLKNWGNLPFAADTAILGHRVDVGELE